MVNVLAFLLLTSSQAYESGATLRLYDIGMPIEELSPLVAGQTPNIDRRISEISLPNGTFGIKDHFLAEIRCEVLQEGGSRATFRITSDDGAILKIDGKTVVSNDGIHPATSKVGTINLTPGWHKLAIDFFESEGGEELKLERKLEDGEFVVLGGNQIRVPANLTRVTSPGPKLLAGMIGKRRPGNGIPLTQANPAWQVVNFRPKDFEPQVGSMCFLPDGSLLVGTFKPNQSGELLPDLRDGKIYRLENVTGPVTKVVTAKVVAENLQEPLGLCAKGDRVFVSTRTEISELMDADHDGVYEATKTVAKAWVADNYHHFTFGLVERNDFLYAALSTSITSGAPGINGPNPAYRGCVMKVDLRTPYDPAKPMANVEFISGGHRTPNGVSLGPKGLVLVGENQGAWQPANKVNVIVPGGFYGHYNNTEFKTAQYPTGGVKGAFDHHPFTQPAVYLPQNECANSPAGMVTIPEGRYKDQLLVSDVKYGGLRRVFLENVNGIWQGGAVQDSQGFEVGTNRLAWGPDGCLYVGGIGATETWAWTNPATGKWTTFGLQKLLPTGAVPYEIEVVKATPTGFRVTFSKPTKAFGPKNVACRTWNYEPTPEYGGDKKNKATLTVSTVRRINDQTFELVIPGLKAGYVSYLNFDVTSRSGSSLWATECWYTLIKRPSQVVGAPAKRILIFSKTQAFRHDSIEFGRDAIKSFVTGKGGFQFEQTEDSSVFNDADLQRFDAIIFLSTTGDVFNSEQEAAFQRFIQRGGGYLGIHAAADTEHEWPFYQEVVGALFKGHPAIQQVKVIIEKPQDPTVSHLPAVWERVDELYNYKRNPRSLVTVLASLDESSYQGGDMNGDHPIIWRHVLGKARCWYTGFGHTASTYREVHFMESVFSALKWVTGITK